MMMLDIKLKTFIAVAQTKSFTKAAQVLNMTQPGVSQHIKNLETLYHVALFTKRHKGIELTSEGEWLYKYAIEIHRMSKALHAELLNKGAILKRYHLGSTMTLGGYVMPPLLAAYKKKNPNVDVILYVDNTVGVVKRLLQGEFVLGVVEGPFDKGKYDYVKLKDDELILVVAPDHPFANQDEVSIESVLSEKLILREKGSGTRAIFENHLLTLGYAPEAINVYMEIGNINALISLVKSNLGCTIISKEAVKDCLSDRTLVKVPISGIRFMREFNFIYFDTDIDFVNDFIGFCRQHYYGVNYDDV